uniref:Uncharacterized protein n=1 Tax=Strongyloides papillosus TaxID=174720 RepID=A0A0N5BES9_STREA
MFHPKSRFLFILVILVGVISTYNLEKLDANDLADHNFVLSNGILVNNDASKLSSFPKENSFDVDTREKRMAPLNKKRMKNKLNQIKKQKQKEIEAHKRNERHLKELLRKQQKQREAAKREQQKQQQLAALKKALQLKQLKERQLQERLRRDEERLKKLEFIHNKMKKTQVTVKPHVITKTIKVLPSKKILW